jgi:hypothetical protein
MHTCRAVAAASHAMTFSGDLKGIGLPDVLQNVQANRLSGTLHVESRAGSRYVELTEGAITALSLGSNRGLPVGPHLVHRGLVTPQQLQAANEKRRGSKKTLRDTLAANKVLADDGFKAALRELIAEHVHELLGWTEAKFSFGEGPPPPRVFDGEQKAAGVRLEIGALLMESARRTDELLRIANVVESDRDVFLRLDVEVPEDLDEVSQAVLAQVDGRTDVGAIVKRVPYVRFEVLKALAGLVLEGYVRACAAAEIEQLVKDALADGDDEGAAVLLRRALDRERNNRTLRERLVEVLERSGKQPEAAAELALLGYHALRGDVPQDAIDFYARAAALAPDDVALAERYVDALAEHGESAAHAQAANALATRLVEAGLAERAAAVLTRACARPELRADLTLVGRLAETEEALGHNERAAELWCGAAELARDDVPGALQMLRRAARIQPGDHLLVRRIHDLETGLVARRRAQRRRFAIVGSVVTVGSAIALAGVMELAAAREVLRTLEASLDDVARGAPAVAVSSLGQVRDSFGWTGSGQVAARMSERLIELQIESARAALAADNPAAATRALERLQVGLERRDQARRLEALLRQARLETYAAELFAAADSTPPLESAQAELARLTDPELVDFHVRHLGKARPGARESLLRALRAIDSPRALVALARLFVAGVEPDAEAGLLDLLGRAKRYRSDGQAEAWAEVLPQLERQARGEEALALRAQQALRLLTEH